MIYVIPELVRGYNGQQKSLGATGEPDGFVYGGTVYVLAGQLATPADVVRVVFHGRWGMSDFGVCLAKASSKCSTRYCWRAGPK